MESLRQLERETLLFLRIFIEGYPHCHLCFREVLPFIADSVYFSHVWCSRLGSALQATAPLFQSFLWTLQPRAIKLCVVLGWPTQRARYFLEAGFHFPMASYCENAMVGSLCQHCFSLPSLLAPACPLETDEDCPSCSSSTLRSASSLIWGPLHVACLESRMFSDNVTFAQSYCFSFCF